MKDKPNLEPGSVTLGNPEYPNHTANFIDFKQAKAINESKFRKLISATWNDNIITFAYSDGTIILNIKANLGGDIWIELRKE